MHRMLTSLPVPLPCGRDEVDWFLSAPSSVAIRMAEALDGPVAVLGAGGKMGLHMAAMLRRALDAAGRADVPVTGVSRFGCHEGRKRFEKLGVQTLVADLLDDAAITRLPDFQTVYFLGAQKVLEGTPIDVTMGYVSVIWQRDAVDHILQAVSLAAGGETLGKPTKFECRNGGF